MVVAWRPFQRPFVQATCLHFSETQRADGCLTVQPLKKAQKKTPLATTDIWAVLIAFPLPLLPSFHSFLPSLFLLRYELIRWDFGSMLGAGSEEQLHLLNPIVLKYEHLGSEIGSAHNDSGWEWLFCLLSTEKNSKSLTLTQCHCGWHIWWL